jgi:hypothetical protein
MDARVKPAHDELLEGEISRRINGLDRLICPTSEFSEFLSSIFEKNILLPFIQKL